MEGESALLRLDLNCFPVLQKEKDPPGDASLRYNSQQVTEKPDLELNMQALSLSGPRVCYLEAGQAEQDQEIQENYMLLMKVACTAGSPRVISEHTINQAMARAWRQYFYAISQVSTNLFMAYFNTKEDMMFVFTRQPWMMGSDNLLLEWVDPSDESKTKDDYRFDHIYATIRAYGIPKEARSLKLLKDILEEVGEPLEFHSLQANMIFSRTEYIWGVAKLKIMQKVVDKITLTLPDKSTTMVYLHYEKIGRICLFCGIMFHTVQHCPLRNELIMERAKYKGPVNDIPFVRFGEWLLDPNLIPQQTMRPRKEGASVLSRFQKMFSDDIQEQSLIQGKSSSTSVLHLPADYNLIQGDMRYVQRAVNLGASERLQLPNSMNQEPRWRPTIVNPLLNIQGGQASYSAGIVQRELNESHIAHGASRIHLSLQSIDMGGKQFEASKRDMNNPKERPENNQTGGLSGEKMVMSPLVLVEALRTCQVMLLYQISKRLHLLCFVLLPNFCLLFSIYNSGRRKIGHREICFCV